MKEIRCGLGTVPEESSKKRVNFKDLKSLLDKDIELGMRIDFLKPSKLYASQVWTDVDKLREALNMVSNLREPTALVIPVYIHKQQLRKGGSHRTIVIGDCHHRTLVWALNGLPVNGEIVATSLPERLKKDIIPFSQFKRLHASEVLTF